MSKLTGTLIGALGLVLLSTYLAVAKSSIPFTSPAVTAKLVTAQNGVPPGAESLSAGLDLDLGEGWKTYWRSPGEVGIPPRVDWSRSRNVERVDFLWPAPARFAAFGIENFGYKDEVLFPLRIILKRAGEPVHLSATVNLLTCSEVCVPQNFDLELSLSQGSSIDQISADRIGAYLKRIPDEGEKAGITSSEAHLDEKRTKLTVELESDIPFKTPDIFPELGDGSALGKPDIRLSGNRRLLWASFPVLAIYKNGLIPPRITVTDGSARSLTVVPNLIKSAPPPPTSIEEQAPALGELLWIASIAFIGGLILNVMPCVLPVLSVKLYSATKQQGRTAWATRAGFLVAAAGTMTFMWALASALFGLRWIGVTIGWGLQFQNPAFLTLMFVILVVFATNLFGFFEITLPTAIQNRLSRSGGNNGYLSDFFTGLFGAVLATPCSAPFLGTAVAFALAGRGIDIFIVFTSLGLGLALPYLAIASAPRLVNVLPKPGVWMTTLRFVLGALLLATTAWLLTVLIGVAGKYAAFTVLMSTTALVTVLVWRRLGAALRWSSITIFAILPLFAAEVLTEDEVTSASNGESLSWVSFDRAQIPRLVSRGQTVFVDVTADWCLTCKANKALVLDRDPVASRLDTEGVTLMRADWTKPDERISKFLESYGRYGIPFNAVFGPGAPDGIVLSEILSSAKVIEALDMATKKADDTMAGRR